MPKHIRKERNICSNPDCQHWNNPVLEVVNPGTHHQEIRCLHCGSGIITLDFTQIKINSPTPFVWSKR